MEGGEVLCHWCVCFVRKRLLDSEVGLGGSLLYLAIFSRLRVDDVSKQLLD